MAELTEEQKEKAAVAKAEKEAKAAAVKAEKEAKAEAKVKVNFGVEIPGVGKFTKEEIEADADIQTMLLEIGSQAVTKL